MPLVNGVYVAPSGGWSNGTAPAIDEDEMNAISNTLALVPIANGGTGQTTAAGIRNALGLGLTTGTLGVEYGGTGQTSATGLRSSLGLGSSTGPLAIANGGTGQTDVTTEAVGSEFTFVKWGKVVMCNYNSASPWTQRTYEDHTVPVNYRPKEYCCFVALGFNQEYVASSSQPFTFAKVAITTSGQVYIRTCNYLPILWHNQTGDWPVYVRFTATWVTS